MCATNACVSCKAVLPAKFDPFSYRIRVPLQGIDDTDGDEGLLIDGGYAAGDGEEAEAVGMEQPVAPSERRSKYQKALYNMPKFMSLFIFCGPSPRNSCAALRPARASVSPVLLLNQVKP